jgi:hypothetical protein
MDLVFEQQTRQMNSARESIKNWIKALSTEPLVQFTDPNAVSAAQELATEYTHMVEIPPRARGDVSPQLKSLATRLESIRLSFAAAQNAFAHARDQDQKLQTLLREFDQVLQDFSSPEIRSKLSESALTEGGRVKLKKDELTQLQSLPLSRRVNADAQLQSAQAIFEIVHTTLQQVKDIEQLNVDLETLKHKIDTRGRELLESKTDEAIAGLTNSAAALNKLTIPLAPESNKLLSDVKSATGSLLGTIDDIMDKEVTRRETERRGREYAAQSHARWSIAQKQDPMTDQVDLTIRSVQRNDNGAVTEIIGKCIQPGLVTFSALVVDEDGKPTIDFPNYSDNTGLLSGRRRINNEPPDVGAFMSDQFHNLFFVLTLVDTEILSKKQPQGSNIWVSSLMNPQKVGTTWRALVEFESTKGAILIEIPLYDTNVRKVVDRCMSP